jgi:hypothetical protein
VAERERQTTRLESVPGGGEMTTAPRFQARSGDSFFRVKNQYHYQSVLSLVALSCQSQNERRIDIPHDYPVISTWQNIDAWDAWRTSRERAEIQEQIDALLGEPTEYEMYEYLQPGDECSGGNSISPNAFLGAKKLATVRLERKQESPNKEKGYSQRE